MIKYFIYRFPILLLIFTTLAIIISCISVFGANYNFKEIVLFLFTGLIFLFHIRIVDDYRDFEHDTKYYSDRELQRGKLNIKKLFISAEILIIIILIVNYFYFGIISVLILILGWINSLSSINYFGYGKNIEKNYMIIFHILNNLTLNTFFIYLYLNIGVVEENNIGLIILHLIFLNLIVFLLEITRKIKSTDDKNTNDKYIDKYGYKKNFLVIFFTSLSIFGLINYFYILLGLSFVGIKYIVYLIIFICYIIINYYHLKYKKNNTKNLILVFSLIFYLYSGFFFI